jgi:homoisocitrate dehydrogenase
LQFAQAEAGWACFVRTGSALPDATRSAVATAGATLFGATQSPSGPVAGYASPILALRRDFDLYANLRPAQTLLPGQPKVDLLIVRENTEGLYSGRERRQGDTAVAERVITRAASERIARVAFEQARLRAQARGRAKARLTAGAAPTGQATVTIVHKANVLKLSDGLFREACLGVAAEYPEVTVKETLVDAAAMWLVKEPARFDVLVTTNLFGDILSDEAAGLVGGLGAAPSANLGAGRVAVFEPVHGSAPDIAGKGIANPLGAILSGAMLLDHVGCPEAAERVRRAVARSLAAGVLSPDLGGAATTGQVVDAVLQGLED